MTVPALGISVSYSAGSGGGSISSSTSYALDSSTSLQEKTSLGPDLLLQNRQATGSGDNSISQHLAGNGYFADSTVDSSGGLSQSATTAATPGSASMVQSVAGSGSAVASVSGSSGADQSGQLAGVVDGSISTTQGLATASGQGVIARQSTGMAGDTGILTATSSGANNDMIVAGGFSGDSDLQANLVSASAGTAAMAGTATVAGIDAINDDSLNAISSGDLLMSVDGIYGIMDAGGIPSAGADNGEFSIKAANIDKSSSIDAATALTGPVGGKGSASSYRLSNWRWNQATPKIQMYVKDDAYLTGRGLTATAVQSAVNAAEKSWDDATNTNLFNNGNTAEGDTAGTGIITTQKKADTYDGTNVVAFMPISGSALAYSRTYYSGTKVGGFNSAIESDLVFNSNDKWTTDLATSQKNFYNFDVQSVATHELGHTSGLLDLYNLPSTDPRRTDYNQVMNAYNDPQRVLGAGDANGIWQLYH